MNIKERNQVLTENLGLSHKIAKYVKNKYPKENSKVVDEDDLAQEGYISMMEALDAGYYNASKGSWLDYYCQCAKRRMNRYMSERNPSIRVPYTKRREIYDAQKNNKPIKKTLQQGINAIKLKRNQLSDFREQLYLSEKEDHTIDLDQLIKMHTTQMEREIFIKFLGLNGIEKISAKQIAKEYSLSSQQAVHYIYRKILARLKEFINE